MKKKYRKNLLSVYTTTEMNKMLKYLESKLLLNPITIKGLRHATLYNQDRNKGVLKCQ